MEITDLNDSRNITDENPKKIFKVSVRSTQDISKDLGHINEVHIEKSLKLDDHHLLSFTMEVKPESGWSNFICLYPDSIWIVDEYCERFGDNPNDLKYKQSTIYRSNKNKILSQHYNFDDLDSLLQLYPVHFGNI